MATPKRLRRSVHLSTFAHMGAVYLFHDLYGYLLQMSPDVLAWLDRFAGGADVAEVGAPAEYVQVFMQHACLIEPDDDELAALWPMVAIKGKWNVWRRSGDRVTLWTAWGDAPVRQIALDDAETRIWDDIDGELRLAELRLRHGEAVLALALRLCHSDVQALKLCGFPMSTYAKRPQMAPAYLTSTMPYRRWTPEDGAPWDEHGAAGREVAPTHYYQHEIADADAQFDHQETTLSHLFRKPHPALGGRTYGAALVEALAAKGSLPARLRVLEIGGGLGWVAAAVLDALAARNVPVEYTIVELSPTLAAAQQERLAGRGVTWVAGDALAVELPDASFDWVIANEMVGDLPALQLSRADIGLDTDGSGTGAIDPEKLAALGPAGVLLRDLGVVLDDAPEPFYLMTGAFLLVARIARWLAPGGLALITEFGDNARWPRLSTHLDHPELSTHFGQLHQVASALGLDASIEFVIDLIGLDRDEKGLATTRSHFRALRAMLADAGVAIEKIGYTPSMLAAALDDKVAQADIGELRWDKIEDRLMGLVPHEFRALIARRH